MIKHSKKLSTKFDVTDFFCGCGGSSQGARKALNKVGGQVALALNHWKLAVETHATNFPEAMHDCTDVQAADPRYYPSTLMAVFSPECTNHSLAKGKKYVKAQLNLYEKNIIDAAAERSRATMWDVPRFAEYHQYQTIIVENVIDARKWVMFESWIHAMRSLGYDYECCYLNSMHFHPTPQSRDRMYVVFWKKGNKRPYLNYTPTAYCLKCAKDVKAIQSWKRGQKAYKYKTGYVYCCPTCSTTVEPYYYAAFNAIDWSIKAQRIGDKKLKPFFKKGVPETYMWRGEETNMLPLSPNTLRRCDYGLAKYGKQPLIVTSRYTSGIDFRVKPTSEAIGTQPADVSHAILTQQPFLTYLSHTGAENRSYPLDQTGKTQSTRQDTMLVAPPFIVSRPLHHADQERHSPINEALPVQTTGYDHSVLLPPFITYHGHSKANDGLGAGPTNSNEAFRTQDTRQIAGVVIPPFIAELNRTGKARSADEALSTLLANGKHHMLVHQPFIVENKGQSNAREATQPLSCLTTKPFHGIISTEAWNSFVGYYYGTSQASHPSEPLGSMRTGEGQYLVKYQDDVKLEDCFYRMIRSHEVGKAMAFDEGYIVLGDEKAKVKQYGNAVTPPVMEWLMERCIESLM